VNNKRGSFEPGKEFEHLPIVFQELFFGVDFASAQLLLQIVFHLRILFGDPFVGDSGSPLVIGVGFGRAEWLPNFLIELSSIVIAVVEVDGSAVDDNSFAQLEVIGGHEFAVVLDVLLAFEELALGYSRILMFLFVDGNGVVFQVEEHFDLPVPFVLGVGLDHAFLEVPEEP